MFIYKPRIRITFPLLVTIVTTSFSVSVERWCRLRGNLLFYFKSRDHWSEPAGVIILEGCQIIPDHNLKESTFGILLVFGGGETQLTMAYFFRFTIRLQN